MFYNRLYDKRNSFAISSEDFFVLTNVFVFILSEVMQKIVIVLLQHMEYIGPVYKQKQL